MTEPQLLPDRWTSRDFPVLLETARYLDVGNGPLQAATIATSAQRSENDVTAALDALYTATPPYIFGALSPARGGRADLNVTGLTERGRRAVGLWPDQEAAADALTELLEQAANQTSDEEDAGALRRASRLLKSVPSAVLADVTAAFIRQQTGLS